MKPIKFYKTQILYIFFNRFYVYLNWKIRNKLFFVAVFIIFLKKINLYIFHLKPIKFYKTQILYIFFIRVYLYLNGKIRNKLFFVAYVMKLAEKVYRTSWMYTEQTGFCLESKELFSVEIQNPQKSETFSWSCSIV